MKNPRAQIRLPAWFGPCAALFLAAPWVAPAQSFSIDWFTIDGGGGTSSGGNYTLSGTIGQPDAGTLTGGNYALQGGFWGVVLPLQTPGAPALTATRSGNNIIISWPRPATGFLLEQTSTLTGSPPPWMQAGFPYSTNATHISITLPMPAGNLFYRLKMP